jgi:hypothetical protein
MAAAKVLVLTESYSGYDSGSSAIETSTTGWDERSLRAQLSLIADAWIAYRYPIEVSGISVLTSSYYCPSFPRLQ